MNITWPNTLPLPSVEGYGLTPQEAVLRTDMESGPARQRRRLQCEESVSEARDRADAADVRHLDRWHV